ncbi:cell division protein ZipA [Dyella dinghuensis]|uniref:Cell division protein ZipA n=1 Tax=Dyella dinghuensis TaxID=1920169 RepID=A0A3S0S509_9GAMM|nr:cell division protein ZipA [Dyella dinghuensis]RUL66138.1 cell division protein ZipA [Dyella dinghuensis]
MLLGSALALEWNPWIGIPLAVVGVIVLILVWLFGEPKREQGKRRLAPETVSGERRDPTFGETAADDGDAFDDAHGERIGPHFSATEPEQGELDMGLRTELEKLNATLADDRHHALQMPKVSSTAASIIETLRAPSQPEAQSKTERRYAPTEPMNPPPPPEEPVFAPAPAAPAPAPRIPQRSDLGKRPPQMPVERIVSLFVIARDGHPFNGADLIVAAEKAGLEYGDMGIYHRLVDGKRELGPIFSVANMVKPGSFDLTRLDALNTPGLSFFMALPGPVTALDAWDTMLPTAQRIAELLDGQVLDEERNALGRQRIAHIRDELRGWDREHDGGEIRFGR